MSESEIVDYINNQYDEKVMEIKTGYNQNNMLLETMFSGDILNAKKKLLEKSVNTIIEHLVIVKMSLLKQSKSFEKMIEILPNRKDLIISQIKARLDIPTNFTY